MRTLVLLMSFFVCLMQQVESVENDCGNTLFYGTSGVVASPNFPLSYPHNLSCTYSIDVGSNNSVLLKFLNFDLESSRYAGVCQYDWLMIACNETDDENLDFGDRFCGTDLPRTSLRFSNCSVVNVEFFADSSVNGGGFSIEYTVFENTSLTHEGSITDLDCGQPVFSSSSGVIRLPTKPADYPARVNCIYTISTNLPSRISIDISAFRRTQLLDSFANCNRDNITIGCELEGQTGPNPRSRSTICRRLFYAAFIQPSSIVFPNCRLVKISIRSSDFNYREAYGISFAVSPYDRACGTTSFTGKTGIVTSPQFPLSYPHNLNCTYSIDVDRTKTVSLDFLSFHLEGLSQSSGKDHCRFDWLTVSCSSYGSEPLYLHEDRQFCGEKTMPMTLNYSKCDSLTLRFVSDIYITEGGYRLRYTIASAGHTAPPKTGGPVEGCGNAFFTGSVGFISSPRFPLSYTNNLDCVYSIDADPTKKIVLSFLSFNIEGTSHSSYMDRCNYDWLTISCLSNGSVSGSSMSAFHHRNRKFCGEKTVPLMLGYYGCDSLTMNFATDSDVTSGGFQLRYKISPAEDESGCGDTSFSGTNGVVTSPNYPFPYPHNMSCKYSIDVGRRNTVLLKFIHFQLEMLNATGYCKDWLMISCNETTKANPNYYRKFCGYIHWISSMRFVDCPSLVLEFASGSTANSTGFVIEYTVVDNSKSTDDNPELDCGATLFKNSSGVISLPRNPKNYLATVNCTYTISANHFSRISFDVYLYPSNPLFQSFEDCKNENMTIGCASEGETDINPSTALVLCRRGRGSFFYAPRSLVFADCRTFQLSIRSTNYDNQETFELPFSVHGRYELCGNTSFSSPSGVISSRQIAWNLTTSVNCLYTIDSGHVNSVVLFFNSRIAIYNINDGDRSCHLTWFTITCLVNGTSVPHPLAGRKLCEPMGSFTARFSACRSVLLNYTGEYLYGNPGFSIRYRMGDYDPECGNTSYSGPNGFITSPQFPLSYPQNMNCLYSITGGKRMTISLSFLSFELEGISRTYTYIYRPFIGLEDSCYNDWLTVNCLSEQSAGAAVDANISSSRRYCGSKTTSFALTFTNCEVVVLNFHSGSSVTRGRFKVRYTVIDRDRECGNTSFSGPNGFITSPKFPLSYPHNLNCLYSITGGKRTFISLSFLTFSLERSSNPASFDRCTADWLTIGCLSDKSAASNISSSRKYCGVKETPLKFTFPNCEAVTLNFWSDLTVAGGGFSVRYTVVDADSICGVPVHGPPAGMISFPMNSTVNGDSFDCNYIINATQPSSISLTIWSIKPQSSTRRNCQTDWLLITCVDGQTALDHKVSHRSCDNLNTSTQLTFPSCAAVQLVNHIDSEATGKSFRIEYTVSGHDDDVDLRTTQLPTTPISPSESVTAETICAKGCTLSANATHCECLPVEDNSQPSSTAISASRKILLIAKCDVGCTPSVDGGSCDCSTKQPGDAVVYSNLHSSGERGRAVGISLTVVLGVIGAICVGAFLIFRRHWKKNQTVMLLRKSEIEEHQLELVDDTTSKPGFRNEDRDTSRYLPLKPVSIRDHVDSSSSKNSPQT